MIADLDKVMEFVLKARNIKEHVSCLSHTLVQAWSLHMPHALKLLAQQFLDSLQQCHFVLLDKSHMG